MFDLQTKPHRNFYFQDVRIEDPDVLQFLPGIQSRTTHLNKYAQFSDDYYIKTKVDFYFQTWNVGLVSVLIPAEPDERLSVLEELCSVREMTAYGYGGAKSLEVLESIDTNDKLWYVFRCSFENDCIVFHSDTITKEHAEYFVKNHSTVKLGRHYMPFVHVTNDALESLTQVPQKLSVNMQVLTPEQAEILASGTYSELYVSMKEFTTDALLALSKYPGKLSLPKALHHRRDLQLYMIMLQQIKAPLYWESESLLHVKNMKQKNLRIILTEEPSLEQLQSIAQYEGGLSLTFDTLDSSGDESSEQSTYQVSQKMLELLSTAKAKSLSIHLPSLSSLDVGVLARYSGELWVSNGIDVSSISMGESRSKKQMTVPDGLNLLVQKYSGPSLSLSIDLLTNDLAKEMVNKPEELRVEALDIEPSAINTLLEASHKKNMTIVTWATPDFCFSHIKNPICHTDIWDCNEGCDSGNPP